MTDMNPLPRELREVESALQGLTPRPQRVDQARLMFLAGQESVRGAAQRGWWSSRAWPVATLLMTAVTLALAIGRPQPEPIIVYRPAVSAPAEQPARNGSDEARDSRLAAAPGDSAAPAIAARPDVPLPLSSAQALADRLPGWLGQRQLALARGVEALPLAAADGGIRPPVSQRELLKEYLGTSGTASPAESTTGVWSFFQRGVP